MDTMKLLLGATIALLLGAVVLSWQGMKQGVRDTPADEIARLQKQVSELRIEQDRLQMEKQMQQLRAAAPVTPTPAPAQTISSAENEQLKARIAEIEAEAEKAKRDADTFRDEAGLIGQRDLEKGDTELRRARLIGEALVMGRVKEFAEDPQFGGFVTFEVLMPENVQSGGILAIRRKTGIVGQIKVSEITNEGAIGNPLPGFGNFKPEPGDELILPPQY